MRGYFFPLPTLLFYVIYKTTDNIIYNKQLDLFSDSNEYADEYANEYGFNEYANHLHWCCPL